MTTLMSILTVVFFYVALICQGVYLWMFGRRMFGSHVRIEYLPIEKSAYLYYVSIVTIYLPIFFSVYCFRSNLGSHSVLYYTNVVLIVAYFLATVATLHKHYTYSRLIAETNHKKFGIITLIINAMTLFIFGMFIRIFIL